MGPMDKKRLYGVRTTELLWCHSAAEHYVGNWRQWKRRAVVCCLNSESLSGWDYKCVRCYVTPVRLRIPSSEPLLLALSLSNSISMTVGVLALQGSFNEHIAALRKLGVKGVEVRKAAQLDTISALIIPGGESTTMAKLAHYHNLFPALRDFVKMGKPVWGTCAGLIFLADKATGQKEGGQDLIGGLNCTVHRNYFGSQIQSFEAELAVPDLAAKEGGPETYRGVFIRAPAILDAGPEVEILADILAPSKKPIAEKEVAELQEEKADSEEKVIVAVKQENLLATAFHPELTADTRWHSYFLKMVSEEEQTLSISEGNLDGKQPTKIDLPIF